MMAPTKKRTTKRILTRHPDGKQGVNIEQAKYDAMRRALLAVISTSADGVPLMELPRRVRDHLDPEVFSPAAGVTWYVTTVKLDLQARGEIERVEGSRPQRLRQTRR